MQVEKAENFDTLSCVIKVHMHFAVETSTHSPLYKHQSYLAKALTSFFNWVWLSSNTVVAVRNAEKDMKETEWSLDTRDSEDLSLVSCSRWLPPALWLKYLSQGILFSEVSSSFCKIKAADKMLEQKLQRRMMQSRQALEL